MVEREEGDGARAVSDAAVALPCLEGTRRSVVQQRCQGYRMPLVAFFVGWREREGRGRGEQRI